MRILFGVVALFLGSGFSARSQSDDAPLLQRQWIEARSAHFNIYSCGAAQDVNRLAARLEQFCEAYTLLAGAQAVASPPITVVAFPDEESMKPFLPLYQGKPKNLAGFFERGSDENLIVLALPGANSAFTAMEVIFHEYAHFLFRQNGKIWPLWLNEGMAEVYSTFESTGYIVRIGGPIEHYLRLLARQPLMPLNELFAVTRDSPQYNEREHQGIFYAESWLLTHFLMAGGTVAYQSRFGEYTHLLRAGELPEQAFTNALRTPLPVMEAQLRGYLERGSFAPIQWALPMNLSSGKIVATRVMTPVEIRFHLGDELLRIGSVDAAAAYFEQAQKLAPASPLPYEGLGLLAVERDQHNEALRDMKAALQRGSTSFLAHYIYAREKLRLTADYKERYAPLEKPAAAEIRGQLEKSITLMPNFGPAHQLLGFFEVVQGENLKLAEQHLQIAIQLEPENQSYLLSLAQAQLRNRNPATARSTLEPLLLPHADAELRKHAEDLLREIGRKYPAR